MSTTTRPRWVDHDGQRVLLSEGKLWNPTLHPRDRGGKWVDVLAKLSKAVGGKSDEPKGWTGFTEGHGVSPAPVQAVSRTTTGGSRGIKPGSTLQTHPRGKPREVVANGKNGVSVRGGLFAGPDGTYTFPHEQVQRGLDSGDYKVGGGQAVSRTTVAGNLRGTREAEAARGADAIRSMQAGGYARTKGSKPFPGMGKFVLLTQDNDGTWIGFKGANSPEKLRGLMTQYPPERRVIVANEMPGAQSVSRTTYGGVELTAENIKDMPISGIANVIRGDWGNVNYAARPYLDAMDSMTRASDDYGMDSGASLINYFLSNASSWRGPTAKLVKAELKRRVRR